jgi:hypothetical protein
LPYQQSPATDELSGFEGSVFDGLLLAKALKPSVDDVRALLQRFAIRGFLCAVLTEVAEYRNPASWEAIVAGAFDEYAKLFATVRASSHSATSRSGLHGVRRVFFDDGAVEYLQQRLCNSAWAPWVKNVRAKGGSSLWSIVPASFPVRSGGAIAAKVENLQRDIDAASVAEARQQSLKFILDFLKEDKRNTALFSRSARDSWSDTINVTTGSMALWNRQIAAGRTGLNILRFEDASMGTVTSLWKPGMGIPPVCALIHDSKVLNSGRAGELLSMEMYEDLVRSTEHVIVGAYGNDLCLIWSNAAIGAVSSTS